MKYIRKYETSNFNAENYVMYKKLLPFVKLSYYLTERETIQQYFLTLHKIKRNTCQ